MFDPQQCASDWWISDPDSPLAERMSLLYRDARADGEPLAVVNATLERDGIQECVRVNVLSMHPTEDFCVVWDHELRRFHTLRRFHILVPKEA